MKTANQNIKPITTKVNESGNIEIGGCDLVELANTYGTPLYVYDEQTIRSITKSYRDAFKSYPKMKMMFASKAFMTKSICKIMEQEGFGLDLCSGGEIYTAKSAGFPMEKMCFHGNNKLKNELIFAVQNGVKYIVIDSLGEVDDLNDICKELGATQEVLVRVNPGVEAHTHHFIQTATVDSKFGFSISSGEAEDVILRILGKNNLKLAGLHCHIGSQIFENKSFTLAVDKMTDFYKYLKETHSINFDVLNLGGGFGIYYAEGDAKKTCDQYAEYIKTISSQLKKCVSDKKIKKPYLILEPGRSIVGEAGITLYSVGRIKNIKNVKQYLAIDGGMFENPRFALYQAKYTVVPVIKGDNCEKYTIAGKCCESGDVIAEDVLLPSVKEGDIIAVLSTGAYNYSMASNYNIHKRIFAFLIRYLCNVLHTRITYLLSSNQ